MEALQTLAPASEIHRPPLRNPSDLFYHRHEFYLPTIPLCLKFLALIIILKSVYLKCIIH